MMPDQDSLPDWQIPGFTELAELGVGSQGRVILARKNSSGSAADLVGIKYLRPSLRQKESSLSAFRHEARILAQVSNAHIARIHDYVETSDGAAIIMEAVNGRSLRTVLDERREPLKPEGALILLKGSLLGLAAAHAVGVIHRDYKPGNIIVQGDGSSKLIDFGIAMLAGAGGRSGTPAYMAPEQWQGGPATPATDIYAATCVFFECITGRRPFLGSNTESLMYQHMTAPIPSHDVPEPLRPLVLKGMAKDPGQRIWDATTLVAELESIAKSEYGVEWEQRGLAVLSAAASVLASTFPLAVISSVVASPGTAAVGSAATQAIGAVESGIKGILTKLSTSKPVLAAAGAAAVITAAWLLWPADPGVGGKSSGRLRVSFERPALLLGNPDLPTGETASPWGEWYLTISPARATPTTMVRVTIRQKSRTPWGIEHKSNGHLRCHSPNSEREDKYHRTYSVAMGLQDTTKTGKREGIIWLYDAPRVPRRALPQTSGIKAVGTRIERDSRREYRNSDCSWHFDTIHTIDFTPKSADLRSGSYLLSGIEGPGTLNIKATVAGKLIDISPRSVGAKIEGQLPRLTVLAE